MRICLISREYPPDTGWGGIATFSRHLALGLSELGHEVVVVSLSNDVAKVVKDENVVVHRVPPYVIPGDLACLAMCIPYSRYVLRSTCALWSKFIALHNEKPFDVIDAPELLAEGLFPAVTKTAPLVIRLYTPHSKFIAENLHNVKAAFDHMLVAMLERVAMLNADAITSPSENLADFVAQDLGYDRSKIKIIHNPIDPNKFHPDGPKALESDGRQTVLFVGRLEERKGIYYLAKAIPEVLKVCPQTRFVIIGDDTKNATGGQHSVLDELKASLQRSKSTDSVIFIPRIPLGDLPAYYRSADISVVPSVYDNSPYTCLEAMSCGKPVIGTTGGGTPEYIVNGESGLIIPVRDEQALAKAIIDLLQNSATRNKLGQNARTRVLEKFQRNQIAANMVELYEEACRNFAQNKQSLYLKETDQAMPDAAVFLYSLDKMIYDMLYQHSWRFRMRHWWRLGTSRPRLLAAKALLRSWRTVFKKESKPSPAFVKWLEQEVSNRHNDPLSQLLTLASSSHKE